MIDQVFNLGDDALQNLFQFGFEDPAFGYIASVADQVPLRIQDFTVPGSGATVYTVDYLTQKFTKVGGKVDAPNEITINIRVDNKWDVVQAFTNWKNAVANSYDGSIGADSVGGGLRTNFSVRPVKSDGEADTSIDQVKFEGAFVQKLGDTNFNYASGDPLILAVTFGFFRMDDRNWKAGGAVANDDIK